MVKLSDVIPQKYFIYIPDKIFLRLLYLQQRKKLPNVRNPKTYSEKMTWLKLHGHLENLSKYADKYEVRNYVKKTAGEKYLIPLYGTWDSAEKIPFEKLPKQFVLKATHGSGYNYICTDKSKLDKKDAVAKLNGWLGENFYDFFRESQYKNIKPRIICEKYMQDEFGDLRDYKFTCVNGKVTLIEVHYDRSTEHKVATLYPNWEQMPFDTSEIANGSKNKLPKPKKLAEMIKVAEKLAGDLPYVRVDLYLVKGKIYFGELTFTPMEGMPYTGRPDKVFGEMLDLQGFGYNR